MKHSIAGIITTIFLMIATVALAENHALLVGCTKYPNLSESSWLTGAKQDVKLMNSLLLSDRFKFKAANIVTLVGWPTDASKRPSYANIVKAIKKLIKKSKPGDQIVLYFSGHGSQQPANKDSTDRETDGLDEIFLPADAGGWDNTKKTVKNVIVDDQIKDWVKAMTDKGAFVWVIFDSCHSGTMLRGMPAAAEKARRIDPATLVPPAALKAATSEVPRSRGSAKATEKSTGLTQGLPGVVAMYAAQSSEPTYEQPLPGKTDPVYGMFTYTMAQVIFQSKGSLTYRELAERVLARYRAKGNLQPTPLIEGTKLDRAVLGTTEWPDRPAILIKGKPVLRTIPIGAGRLHGLRKGTILAVYPPAGEKNSDDRLGHIMVTRASSLTALAKPHQYENYPQATEFRAGSRCQIVYIDYGDMRLRIGVQSEKKATDGKVTIKSHKTGAGPESVEIAVKLLLIGAPGLMRREEEPSDAHWFVRAVGDQVVLLPSSGWPVAMNPKKKGGDTGVLATKYALGSIKDPKELARSMYKAFLKIAKARQLLNLAALTHDGGRSRIAAVDIKLDMILYAGDSDKKGKPVPHSGAGRVLHDGDLVSFTVTNTSRHSIDVTLLFVDNGYGIASLFPEPGTIDDNRLAPGETLVLPRVEVTADTVGAEQIVAIAVKSGRERQNFTCLEQVTLEKARGAGNDLKSPLGLLLQSSMYGKGQTRGLRASQIDAYAVRLLPWVTKPAARE